MDTYTYAPRTGWTPVPPALALPAHVPDVEALADWLFLYGYHILAETHPGRCLVGHFQVWHCATPPAPWPAYAIAIDQVGAESVVWIATLPDLWEFVRRYGQIGMTMGRLWAEDAEAEDDEAEDDEAEDDTCPDCGAPLLWLPSRPDDSPPPGFDA